MGGGEKVIVSPGRARGTAPGLEEAALGEREPGSPDYLWSPGIRTCSAISFSPLPWRMLMHQGLFGDFPRPWNDLPLEQMTFGNPAAPSAVSARDVSVTRHSLTKQTETHSTEDHTPINSAHIGC